MVFRVGRLVKVKKTVRRKVISQSRFDITFSQQWSYIVCCRARSFVVVSRLQELRDDGVAQGQHQAGTIRGAVQRLVAVDSMHGAQQDDAAAASRSHRQVCQRRQGKPTRRKHDNVIM